MIEDKPWAYITDLSSGVSRWDCPTQENEGHLRLILCPDEGGPLWSAYQFLAHSGAAVGFRRDELFFACMLTNCYADMQRCMRFLYS